MLSVNSNTTVCRDDQKQGFQRHCLGISTLAEPAALLLATITSDLLQDANSYTHVVRYLGKQKYRPVMVLCATDAGRYHARGTVCC